MTDYDALCARLTGVFTKSEKDDNAIADARDAIAALVARVAELEPRLRYFEETDYIGGWRAKAEAAEARVKELEATVSAASAADSFPRW